MARIVREAFIQVFGNVPQRVPPGARNLRQVRMKKIRLTRQESGMSCIHRPCEPRRIESS